jgi:hypothetical protein
MSHITQCAACEIRFQDGDTVVTTRDGKGFDKTCCSEDCCGKVEKKRKQGELLAYPRSYGTFKTTEAAVGGALVKKVAIDTQESPGVVTVTVVMPYSVESAKLPGFAGDSVLVSVISPRVIPDNVRNKKESDKMRKAIAAKKEIEKKKKEAAGKAAAGEREVTK